MTTYEYFTQQLGESPNDETLQDLPLEAPCGQDCKLAIDGAVTFLRLVDSSLRNEIIGLANEAVEIFWKG